MKNNIWIYDLETYKYMFLACFKNVETGQWEKFEISNRKNDIKKLYQFLSIKNLELVGFNNLEFDYPVLHNTILNKRKRWSSVEIYNEANNIIEAEYSSIWDKYVKIPQIDLFAIKHYKNPARSTSLKWLEYAMRMDNIEDLPFDPSIQLNSSMMDKIIEYCDHDVNATELFYHQCSKDIELRKQLSKVYNLDLTNANDPKIGSEIFLDLLSKEMKVDKWDLKNERTYRKKINFKDIIIPYVKYDTPEMNKVLNAFKNYSTGEGIKDFQISGKIGNIINDFGQGGLHGCTDPGVYESTKDRIIIDIDVASYYPNMAIDNKFRPQHLGESFSKIYSSIYELRKTFPKSDPRNTACKLMLNGSFGKMSDVYSFLYDPKALYSITINGQLLLTMLMEKINSYVNNIEFLQSNTDGFTFIINRDKVNYMKKIVNAWEKKTNLKMEYAIYDKMIIRDVNNYLSITDTGIIKHKGCFEIDRDFHKNHSKRIVAIALSEYYTNGVLVEDTILNHLKNNTTSVIKEINDNEIKYYNNYGIFDFCLGAKMKGKNKLYARTINNNSVNDEKLGRVTRYYVSNNGVELIKKLPPSESNYITETDKHPDNQINIFDIIEDKFLVNPKDRETSIEAGWKCTVFNKYIKENYDINYKYYIDETNKIINKIK